MVPTTSSAPATSKGSTSGFGSSWVAGTTVCAAWLERVQEKPKTTSPASKSPTPGPVWTTMPARSVPWPEGKVAGSRSCTAPERITTSPGLMPAARTCTSTSPWPGMGMGTSRTESTSRPP